MRKKILTASLALTMAFAITACGDAGNSKETTTQTESLTEAVTEATTEQEKSEATTSETTEEKSEEVEKDTSDSTTEEKPSSSTSQKVEDSTTADNANKNTASTSTSQKNEATSTSTSEKNTSTNKGNGGSQTADSNKDSNKKPSKPQKPTKPTKPTKPSTPANDTKELTVEEIAKAVKKAYGDSYIPNMTIDTQTLAEQYGITEDMYDEVYAEGPMLSFQIDTFIAVKAKDGKVDKVKKAMENYKEYLVKESMQYPMNASKLPAIQIYNFDNYVFFSMLVTPPEETGETEEEILEGAKAQNQIAYDTIQGLFK